MVAQLLIAYISEENHMQENLKKEIGIRTGAAVVNIMVGSGIFVLPHWLPNTWSAAAIVCFLHLRHPHFPDSPRFRGSRQQGERERRHLYLHRKRL